MPDVVGTLKPPRLNTAPSAPALGQLYYDVPLAKLRNWNGSAWVDAAPGAAGAQGPQGVQGPQGNPGATGPASTVPGPQGPAGPSTPQTLPARLAAQGGVEADLNALSQNGWYRCVDTTLNTPHGSYGQVKVQTWADGDTTWVHQWCKNLFGDQEWRRWKNNTVWTPWVQTYPVLAANLPVMGDANLPARISTSTLTAQVSDANSITANGWYYVPPSGTNTPGGADWFIQHFSYSGSYIARQIAHRFYQNETYVRSKDYNAAWTAWTKTFPIDDANLPLRIAGTYGTTNNDCNLHESGWSAVDSSGVNRPPGTAYVLIFTIRHAGGAIARQTAYEVNSSTFTIWTRYCWGSWSGWAKTFPIDDTNLPDRISSDGVHGQDPNNLNTSGFANSNGFVNGPDTGHWHIMTCAHSTSYFYQLAVSLYSDVMKMRRCVSGSFGGWVQIYPPPAATLADTGWVTLGGYSNNYSGYGAPWGPPAVRKIGNVVHCRGLIQSWGSGNTETILTIGGGFRPGQNQMWNCRTDAGTCRMDLYPDGTLRCDTGSPGAWISINEISYVAEG